MKYGYVTPYGGKDEREDIATFKATLTTNPSAVQWVENDHSLYRKKIELLYAYGFITTEHYSTALNSLDIAEKTKSKPPKEYIIPFAALTILSTPSSKEKEARETSAGEYCKE